MGKKTDIRASKEQSSALVERLKQGDRSAQAEFYRAYRDRLFKAAAYFLGPQDPEVEDVIQETFIKAFAAIGSFEGRSEVYTWLNKICVNLCFQILRRRQKLVAAAAEDLEALTAGRAIETHARLGEEDKKEVALKLLRQALKLLPDKCGAIVRLRDVDGGSYSEIAKKLKVPMGTVFSRLARCREALKSMLLTALKEEGVR